MVGGAETVTVGATVSGTLLELDEFDTERRKTIFIDSPFAQAETRSSAGHAHAPLRRDALG
jgi:hypothetical protein